MYDLIIKNGKIVDGTGSPFYRADIAVKDGKIAKIGKALDGAQRIIDATGLTVTPGFIDSHSHSDSALESYPGMIEKAEQGITTSIGGQCGGSAAPDRDEELTMGAFLDRNVARPLGSNLGMLIGHGTVRRYVMGPYDRDPTAEELEQMKALVRDAMEHGALGMSFGWYYAPGCFSKTEESIALASVVGEYHGVIAAHIRNESDHVVESVKEFITVARASGCRGVISHHKSAHEKNWGKVKETLKLIDQANEDGLEIYCDVYPYCASNTTMSSALVPAKYRAEGNDRMVEQLNDPAFREAIHRDSAAVFGEDLSWVMISSCSALPQYQYRRISEIAQDEGKTHYDAMLDIVRDSKASCGACFFTMCEEDVTTVMRHPRSMICTDSGVARHLTKFHPRLRGTFPRVLGRYVREQGVTTLPEMIRKITAMPAMVYGLTNKGQIHEGFDADICIFDADKIIDRADFVDCSKHAEGLNYVIVGGKVAAENAVFTGELGGKLLLRE